MSSQAMPIEDGTNNIVDVSSRPDFTAAARERRLVNLAYDEAERRLKDGTATSEMVCHFLRMGSNKEFLEEQNLAYKVELTKAKTEMYKAAQKTEEMFLEAFKAFGEYGGDNEDL